LLGFGRFAEGISVKGNAMKKFLQTGAFLVMAAAPALAQPEFTTKPAETPPPPANMSCDDLMTNAELKLQTVIDADKKEAAMKHMKAAEDAITKNDPDTCKAEVQKAIDSAS
jgi:hypothetical protein